MEHGSVPEGDGMEDTARQPEHMGILEVPPPHTSSPLTQEDLRLQLQELAERTQVQLRLVAEELRENMRCDLQKALLLPVLPAWTPAVGEKGQTPAAPRKEQTEPHKDDGEEANSMRNNLEMTGNPIKQFLAQQHDGCCAPGFDTSVLNSAPAQAVKRLAVRSTSQCESLRQVLYEGSIAAGQATVARLVQRWEFDSVIALLIFLNAASIGLATDHMARNVSSSPPTYIRHIEIIFLVAFCIELFLRIMAQGRAFFVGPDWRWNIFDMAIVTLQVVDAVAQEMMVGIGAFARSVRILRLTRVMRIVRVLRVIGELRGIISSIVGSLRHVLWTLALLLLLIYSLAVVLTQLVSDYHADVIDNQLNPQMPNELTDFFGSVSTSVLTLFQAIAGGCDWIQITSPLTDHISVFATLSVCVYISFVMFAIMNSVTGIFVESATRAARKDTDTFLRNLACDALVKADLDQNGSIDWAEFQQALRCGEMDLYFEALEFDSQDAVVLFQLLDVDGNGTVNCSDFVNMCKRLRGPAKALDFAAFLCDYRNRHEQLESRCHSVEQCLHSLLHMRMAERDLLENVHDKSWPANEGVPQKPTTGSDSVTHKLEACNSSAEHMPASPHESLYDTKVYSDSEAGAEAPMQASVHSFPAPPAIPPPRETHGCGSGKAAPPRGIPVALAPPPSSMLDSSGSDSGRGGPFPICGRALPQVEKEPLLQPEEQPLPAQPFGDVEQQVSESCKAVYL